MGKSGWAFARKERDIRLLAATHCPAETDPGSEGWRALSLCILPPAGAEPGPGRLGPAAEDRGVWMGRVAALRLQHPAAALTLRPAAVAQSWVPPRPSAVDAGVARG
jgi:hypothetical protein